MRGEWAMQGFDSPRRRGGSEHRSRDGGEMGGPGMEVEGLARDLLKGVVKGQEGRGGLIGTLGPLVLGMLEARAGGGGDDEGGDRRDDERERRGGGSRKLRGRDEEDEDEEEEVERERERRRRKRHERRDWDRDGDGDGDGHRRRERDRWRD